MYHCASAAALLASASELISDTRVLLLITFDSSALLSSQHGTQHPAAEISRFNTHNQHLVASGVTLSGYILGMLLLGALPSKWDHVAAIYLQGKTAHTAIDYTEVQNAIIVEFDRTGTSPGQQQHVHKISAVKRKGDHPLFSQQRSNTNAPKARNDGQGSSNKKKPKKSNKGKGKQAHFIEHEPAPTPFSLAASAVRPMIALQPSRAGPSTTTVASINPNRVTYSTVATPKNTQQYTGAPRKVGPNTLQKERGLPQEDGSHTNYPESKDYVFRGSPRISYPTNHGTGSHLFG